MAAPSMMQSPCHQGVHLPCRLCREGGELIERWFSGWVAAGQRDNPGQGSSAEGGSPAPTSPSLWFPEGRLGSACLQQGCPGRKSISGLTTFANRLSSVVVSGHLEAIYSRDEIHALCAGRWEFSLGVLVHTHTPLPAVGVCAWGQVPSRPQDHGAGRAAARPPPWTCCPAQPHRDEV